MARKIELRRAALEKEKINKLIDGFYVQNTKKEGEAYATISAADWQLAWALLRIAESLDETVSMFDKLERLVNKMVEEAGNRE